MQEKITSETDNFFRMSEQEIEDRLEKLPSGYISKKNINGKTYCYYQWREAGKVKSRYLKKAEVQLISEQLEQKRILQEMLRSRKLKKRLLSYRERMMQGSIAIGVQNYEKLVTNHLFYVDKTQFLTDWWNSHDEVTLITRPRRFGKTLMLSTVECFFSKAYAGRSDLFESAEVWKNSGMRKLQGTYPVISLTFGGIKSGCFPVMKKNISLVLYRLFGQIRSELEKEGQKPDSAVNENAAAAEYQRRIGELEKIRNILFEASDDAVIAQSLSLLSEIMYFIYRKKVIILLDEYDTPLEEAYISGCYEETVEFMRDFFNNSFKSNSCMECAILTGITRIGKESLFSDMNHLSVHGMTDSSYGEAFGFTEKEVREALKAQGIENEDTAMQVKNWYDGFSVGVYRNIYNPWSIINFLKQQEFHPYWVNTGSNNMVGKLILGSDLIFQDKMEKLLRGEMVECELTEEVTFSELQEDCSAVWSLLLAAGYIKLEQCQNPDIHGGTGTIRAKVSLTNSEVRMMMRSVIRRWFGKTEYHYNCFVNALLEHDLESMNGYLNRVAQSSFSVFDTGRKETAETEPERFYHGFVLGLLVELENRYIVHSNRESGFGRYDVCLIPRNPGDDGYVLEFKLFSPTREKNMEETVKRALDQIEEKQYDIELSEYGVEKDHIFHYGFAFRGKEVLIGT